MKSVTFKCDFGYLNVDLHFIALSAYLAADYEIRWDRLGDVRMIRSETVRNALDVYKAYKTLERAGRGIPPTEGRIIRWEQTVCLASSNSGDNCLADDAQASPTGKPDPH